MTMMDADQLDKKIDAERNEIRASKLDITYSELATMFEEDELKIAPDYQRLFRWDSGQKTKFIESILLGIPTPAIFVAEDQYGKWELVDGLQRISTVLEFMGVLKDADGKGMPPSKMKIPDQRVLLAGLDGHTFRSLSLRSRLSIKRASCRVEVIKIGSRPTMKYEVFERLNTGGAGLTHHEVRNCIFRATDPEFMKWVDRLAQHESFQNYLGLSEFQQQSMYDRGLVLRYFTMKKAFERFEHDIEPFITEYARDIIEGRVEFDRKEEEPTFMRSFDAITGALEDDAWRHYRNGKHTGPFSVYVFDVLTVAVARNLDYVLSLTKDEVRRRCIAIKEDAEFVQNTGAGANTRARALARFQIGIRIMGPKKPVTKPTPRRVKKTA